MRRWQRVALSIYTSVGLALWMIVPEPDVPGTGSSPRTAALVGAIAFLVCLRMTKIISDDMRKAR